MSESNFDPTGEKCVWRSKAELMAHLAVAGVPLQPGRGGAYNG